MHFRYPQMLLCYRLFRPTIYLRLTASSNNKPISRTFSTTTRVCIRATQTRMSFITGNSFNPDTEIPDLKGKTYLVTGGSVGIGFGVCAHLIQHNARVLMLSNKEDHAEEAIEQMKQWGNTDLIEWIKCDLANLKQTDEAANKILEKESVLHGVGHSSM